MTAQCFGCSGRFEPAQLETVGDTVFCRACLARMLRRVDARATQPPADAPCFICGAPLEGAAFVALRGFAICEACSRGLIREDLPGAAVANDDQPPPRDELRDMRQALRGPPVETPGTGTEWCARCGRAMPGRGSYQLVDGRPHCAACVAARSATPDPTACEACQRPVSAGTLRETHGFWLCVACLDSDPELARAVAKAHHRRRLARAGRRLLEDEDD